MLRIFRDNLKYLSWVLWLVILVFVVFMFTDFGSISPTGGAGTAAAARVGNYEISYSAFQSAYQQQEAQLAQAYGGRLDPEMARQIGLPRQVMEYLVTEKILHAEADRMGVKVSDEEVRERIFQYPVFQDGDGNFVGEEAYQSILRSNRMTAASFEEAIRQEMLTDRVREILNNNIYVSDAEVEESYREQAERAKIRFVRLPGADFADQVVLDDAEVAAYFAEHRADFEIPQQRVVDYLLINPMELQATIEISDAEIAAYYRENNADYTSEEQVRARHILAQAGAERSMEEATRIINEARRRIEGGEDFTVVAIEVSDDPGSREKGGDLGSFGRGQMVGPFEEAVFSATPGELVGPVETSFGVHLIEVLGRTEGGVEPLEKVSTSIRNNLANERARALAATRAVELRERIRREKLVDPEALEALAEGEEAVSFATTPAFAAGGIVPGLGRAAAFSTTAFGLDDGEISDPVQLSAGWAILRLKEIRQARLPELTEVDAEVRAAVRSSKQVELASAALAAARQRLTSGTTLDEVAEGLGTEVQESEEFGAGGLVGSLGSNPAVAHAALSLDEGAFGGPVSDDNQAVLFEVVERKRFDPATFAEEREATRSELAASRAGEMLTALITARREEMGVVYDPTFLENFEISGS